MNLIEKIESRQKANRQILEKISETIEKYPELRFHQILLILEINKTELVKISEKSDIDPYIEKCSYLFSEESIDTLNRLNLVKK